MRNSELKEYLEREILPRYDAFDEGHDRVHAENVIRAALELAREYDADEEMVLTIAAYHDVGLEQGREEHHLYSARALREDRTLERWFTPEQIELMAQAVEDHRASSKWDPRSLYGKIVADADREYSPERLLYRSLKYGKRKYGSLTKEQQFDRVYDHCCRKYGPGGYIRFYLKSGKADRERERLWALLEDRRQFDALCESLYEE